MKTAYLALVAIALAPAAFAADTAAGKAVFDRTCAACHTPTGEGIAGVFPPLKQSDYFKKATPAQLLKIVGNGLTGPVTVNGQTINSAMPPQNLSDEEAAAVLNYVSIGLNGGKAIVAPAQVAKLRAAK